MLSIPPLGALHWWPYESLLEDWPPQHWRDWQCLMFLPPLCSFCEKSADFVWVFFSNEKNNGSGLDFLLGHLKVSCKDFKICVMFHVWLNHVGGKDLICPPPPQYFQTTLGNASDPLRLFPLANPWQDCCWMFTFDGRKSSKSMEVEQKHNSQTITSSSNFQLLFFPMQVLEFWRLKERNIIDLHPLGQIIHWANLPLWNGNCSYGFCPASC